MTEQHDREWLKHDVNQTSSDADNDLQLQKLQKLMHHCATTDAASSNEATDDSKPISRLERKQRLKQNTWGSTQPGMSLSEETTTQAFAVQQLPLRQETRGSETIQEVQSPKQLSQQVKGCMPKKKKDEYQEWLKQDFSNLFEALPLKEHQRHYLRSRWLDQVLWMEGRAGRARDMHYKLRLTTILGGVIIPALVSLNFVDLGNKQLKQALSASTFILSQVVAISAAGEQFFNYGERWRHYRRGVESLKTQGWQYFELSGPYHTFKTHEEAFHSFAGQVEEVLQRDVEVYATQVTQAKKEGDKKDEAPQANGRASETPRPSPEVPRKP